MNRSRLFTILGFILVGIISRFIPHAPNFTALNAIALFSSFYFKNPWIALTTVLTAMFFSDLALGLHSGLAFVYLSFGLVVLLGHVIKENNSLLRIPASCLASSLLFFVVTNFGEWLTGCLYTHTAHGFGMCYLAALPFLSNQIFGDLFYGVLIFGCFALSEKLFPKLSLNKTTGCFTIAN